MFLGTTRARLTVLASWWSLRYGAHCQLCAGGIKQGTMASVSTSVWEKVAPPAFVLKPDYSFPSCMFFMPFQLFSGCWSSEKVNMNKTVHGSFKRNIWDSRSLPSHLSLIPADFHSQKLWGLLCLALEPWARGHCVRLGSTAQVGVGPAFLESPLLLPVST